MIRSYRGILPRIASSCYIDPTAQVIGDVEIGEHSSLWMNVVVRGDVNFIRIGAESNVQDNSVIHVQRNEWPTILGNRVTIGHSVTLHGCEIEDECMVGIGAIVLNGARIGTGSIIAAGALVPEGMHVSPGSIVMGVPAKVRRSATAEDHQRIVKHSSNYVMYRQTYLDEEKSN
ncbi:MAG: gamma carbonic anhydrase family protein [Bryobacteraceae bacterium]